jgi:hypothetical protein
MPVSKPSELKVGGEGRWPNTGWKSEQWGDMVVGHTVSGPLDCTELYAGLPGGVCPCPHYGYMISGKLRCVYPGSDWPEEVAVGGDAYFFPAGHVLIYDEPSEVVEFNPADALARLMTHIERLIAPPASN